MTRLMIPGRLKLPGALSLGGQQGQGKRYLGQVATRCRQLNAGGAVNKIFNSRSRHIIRDNITALRISLATWFVPTNHTETALGVTPTYTAAIENAAGNAILAVIKWSGATSVVAPSGVTLDSDLVPVSLSAGSVIFVRVYCNSPGNIAYEDGQQSGMAVWRDIANGECFQFANTGISDLTQTPGPFTNSDLTGRFMHAPVAIEAYTKRPSIFIYGDSRVAGVNDSYDDGSTNIGEQGRSVGPNFAYIGSGDPGVTAQGLSNAGLSPLRIALGKKCSHMILEAGGNDLIGGTAPATIIGYLQTIRTNLNLAYSYLTTEPPIAVTSTNAYADAAGQTSGATETNRVTLNGLIRAGVAGFTGYFEFADVAEGGRNIGKWRTDTVQAAFTASISATTLTVSAVASGALSVSQQISGANVIGGNLILSGTGPYTITYSQTIASEVMAANAVTPDGTHETPLMNKLYNTSGVINPNVISWP